MKTYQQSTAINAIRNYVYFTYNFPQPDELIRNCWAGEGIMAEHLLEKLRSYDYDINKFFVNLDTHQQERFAAWIYEHYHNAPKGTDEKRTIIEMWHQFKANHPDHIILFRCGDFYRAIGEDARVVASTVGISLLNRNDDNPLHPQVECAFPYHALDTYLPKLVRYVNMANSIMKRIAICDQLEDPRLTKKLVKRGSTETTFEGYHGGDTVYSKKHGMNKTIFMAHRSQSPGEKPKVNKYTFSDMTSATPDEVEDAH